MSPRGQSWKITPRYGLKRYMHMICHMIASRHGNAFRVTCLFTRGELTPPPSSATNFRCCLNRLGTKRWSCRWLETLWRSYDANVMMIRYYIHFANGLKTTDENIASLKTLHTLWGRVTGAFLWIFCRKVTVLFLSSTTTGVGGIFVNWGAITVAS